jgi:hypothetical protein
VTLYGGSTDGSAELGRLSGSLDGLASTEFASTGSSLLVRFGSDGSVGGEGFGATYECPSPCSVEVPAGGSLGDCPGDGTLPVDSQCSTACSDGAVLPQRCSHDGLRHPVNCCDAGAEWDGEDGTVCSPCEPGSSDHDSDPATPCLSCPSGRFSGGVGVVGECSGACANGLRSLAGSTSAEGCVDPASACTYDAAVVEHAGGAQSWIDHFDSTQRNAISRAMESSTVAGLDHGNRMEAQDDAFAYCTVWSSMEVIAPATTTSLPSERAMPVETTARERVANLQLAISCIVMRC